MNARVSADPLVAALTRYLGPLRGLRHDPTAWYSATFSGARHRLHFTLHNDCGSAERIREIMECDLPLTGSFVAEIELVSAVKGHDGLDVELAVLTIAE